MLSQHTHMPMRPEPAAGKWSRTGRSPRDRSPARSGSRRWLSKMLLHFDAHELHHLHPAVPGYRLREIPAPGPGTRWAGGQWVPAARAVPGEVFLFQNRNQSGLNI